MSVDQATLAQFEMMINALMSNDNNMRSQAEAAFNQAKANPNALMASLITMLRSNQSEQVRSLCAVLMRKAVMQSASQSGDSLIKSLDPGVADTLKKELLACIEAEPQRNIRKKVCDAVGQLGINLLSENMSAWPELLPFMLAATKSGNVNMHEAALTIFNAFSEFISEKMVPYHATLLEVFRASLQPDQAMLVRVAALKALASFLLALTETGSRNAFQDLVPLMLQTIADALSNNDEGEVRSALEVFVEVAESQPKFLKVREGERARGRRRPRLGARSDPR